MRLLLLCFLFLAFAASAGRAQETNAEGMILAGKVREIFAAKCLDCHGPDLPRPKKKFGYVLDLKRVAANAEWVDRGHPEKSDLYIMVRDDEMPGEDAKVPALTKDEKETVRRWIELGAPEPINATEPVLVAPVHQIDMPTWKRALRLVGRLHPASTHFPVALMIVAAFAEALAWWTRRDKWLHTVRFLVILAAAGAVFTASLGWINAWFTSYVGESVSILSWHRWVGTGAAVWAVICAGLILLSDCREGSSERTRFRAALFLGAVLVGVSGFLGSALIYGLDHYAW